MTKTFSASRCPMPLAALVRVARFVPILALLFALPLPALWASPVIENDGGAGTSGNGAIDVGTAPGAPYTWEGHVGSVKTDTGNKMIQTPLVSWTTRGGMSVNYTLTFNSTSQLTGGAVGPKTLGSYDTAIAVNGSTTTVYWDDGSATPFTLSGGVYVRPPGVYDTLVANGSPITSYDLTRKDQTRYHFVPFTSGGSTYIGLTSITDEKGNTITINRSATGGVSSIVDPTGRTLTIGYSSGHRSSITDPLGRVWTINYTTAGEVTDIIDPAIGYNYSYRAFAYNTAHDITQIQDHNNNQSYLSYNTDNTLAWEQDPRGNKTSFSYSGFVTTITDPNGHQTIHTYDSSTFRLARVTDPLGNITYYNYDSNGNVLNVLDGRTYYHIYTYDSLGNLLSAQDPATPENSSGNTTHWTYNAHNRPLTQTDALGNTVTNTYDSQDNLLTSTVNNAPGTATTFHSVTSASGYSYGLPSTTTDALSHSSTIGYDANGYVNSVTDPNSHTSTAVYNALGWKTSSTDALGHTTSYTYDTWGRPTVVTAPDLTQTSTSYDANGNVLRAADADAYNAPVLYAVHCGGAAIGHFSADAYYSGGYTVNVAPTVSTTGLAYPAPASLYQYERAGTFSYAFPSLTPGRLYSVRLHFAELSRNGPGLMLFHVVLNGTQVLTNYDPYVAGGGMYKASIQEFTVAANSSGQIVIAFNPGPGDVPTCSGIEILPHVHTVSAAYDADNRPFSTANGNGNTTTLTYDGPSGYGSHDVNGQTQYGLLSKKTDGNGHTTTYTYTARNEPYQSFYPDGAGEGIAYDANGNPTAHARLDGSLVHYYYDAANRLTDVNYPHMAAVHFDYDKDSRRTHMHDSIGDTYWYFDDGLHLTHQNSNRGNVFYTYDADSRRATMTGYGLNPSAPNTPFTYGYDAGSRLTSVQNPFGETTGYQYDAADRVTQKTLANGAYIGYTYDAMNRTTDLLYHFGSTAYAHHYVYEPNGSLASRSESDGGTNAFVRDGIGQLISEVRAGPVPFNDAYTYDGNGNRLTMTQNGTLVQSFAYDSRDRLTGGINETDVVDVNGDLRSLTLNGQTNTLTYDDEDRLTSVAFPGGRTDTYTYNGLGQRITKSDPTGSYWYMDDGAGSTAPVLSDAYTTFSPGISEYNGLGSRFYLPDMQGNSRGLLDASQNSTDGYNWDAFGNSASRFGTNPTALSWGEGSGYQNDNNGLKMLGARYYDSRTGRFLSRDPAKSGSNWYAYAANDPTTNTDPTGNFAQSVEGISIGGGEFRSAVAPNTPGDQDYDSYVQNQADNAQQMKLIMESMKPSGPAVGQASFDLYLGQNYSQTEDPLDAAHPGNGGFNPATTPDDMFNFDFKFTQDDNDWVDAQALNTGDYYRRYGSALVFGTGIFGGFSQGSVAAVKVVDETNFGWGFSLGILGAGLAIDAYDASYTLITGTQLGGQYRKH